MVEDKEKVLVVIPSRYGSSRFPGKPLAKIGGEEMIVRVCHQVSKAGFPMVVATDDVRIAECVKSHGFTAVMTSADHPNGTSRICEAVSEMQKMGVAAEIVINVQGDEPFIHPDQIKALADIFIEKPATDIATLCRVFDKSKGFEALSDPNLVKLTMGAGGEALYFSRSIIPYVRGVECKEWLDKVDFRTHVGIYAYRTEVLRRIVELPKSPLELAESLEQLRWLENGYHIAVAETIHPTVGIDTPADLEEAEKFLASQAEL